MSGVMSIYHIVMSSVIQLCVWVSYCCFLFVMRRQPPRSTRTDTHFPYTTLFRSLEVVGRKPVIQPIVGRDQPEEINLASAAPALFDGSDRIRNTLQIGRAPV